MSTSCGLPTAVAVLRVCANIHHVGEVDAENNELLKRLFADLDADDLRHLVWHLALIMTVGLLDRDVPFAVDTFDVDKWLAQFGLTAALCCE